MRKGRFGKTKCFKIGTVFIFLLKERENMLLKIYSKLTIQLHKYHLHVISVCIAEVRKHFAS